jgi:RNA-directed DNA polymerase
MPRSPNHIKIAAKTARLDIESLRKLEFSLGTVRSKLRAVALVADTLYSPFPKPDKLRPFQKKFPKKKDRLIDNPIEPLRGIQKQIQRKLLGTLDLPFYLCGGVKGRTLLDNMMLHAGAATIVTIDIKDFFPSIDNRRVYFVWTKVLGCAPRIGAVLTRLTTRNHYLPQGSSTSTMLANLALFSVDEPIREASEKAGVHYSTWVDDLAFSGSTSRDIIPVVIQTLRGAGFSLSRKKIKIMGPGTRKVLNGVLADRFPSVLPERLSQLRSGIHKLRTNQVPMDSQRKYVIQLGSSIAQVGSINSGKARRLQEDFDLAVKTAYAANQPTTVPAQL